MCLVIYLWASWDAVYISLQSWLSLSRIWKTWNHLWPRVICHDNFMNSSQPRLTSKKVFCNDEHNYEYFISCNLMDRLPMSSTSRNVSHLVKYLWMSHNIQLFIRESVDSLWKDGADPQYMQYLNKSRITSPQIYTLKACWSAFLFECFYDQQDSFFLYFDHKLNRQLYIPTSFGGFVYLASLLYHPICIYFLMSLFCCDDCVPSHMIVQFFCIIVYIGNEELQSITSAIGGLLQALEQTQTKWFTHLSVKILITYLHKKLIYSTWR